MPPVQIALYFPSYVWPDTQRTDPLTSIRECIQRAEDYGFDIWVIDHLLVAPGLYGATWLDPMAMLNYAAALTRRVHLGTGILVAPVRQPVLLAKEIGSLQLLCEGRFKLGVGPGWHAKEYEAVGAHISQRGPRTDEMIEALELLLTRERVSYHGRYYRFDDVTVVPRAGMPELWVAGGSRQPDPQEKDPPVIAESVKRRIVKAGRWLARASGTHEWVRRDWQALRAHARTVGKDPDSLVFGMCNFFHFVDAKKHEDALTLQRKSFERVMGARRSFEMLQKGYLLGTTGEIIDTLRGYADAGCRYFCIGPTMADPKQLDILAKEVAPRLT
jgi:alkanesulfonate monooxygenase SsuD/methylene tetrahydromethanopterin reductase-like flavin-dependent oxidoreductase (luciferase family)